MKDKHKKKDEKEFDVDDITVEEIDKIDAETAKENSEAQPSNQDDKKVKEPEVSEVDKLKAEVEALKHEMEVTKNAYYRAYADCDNLKKRLQNEADQANKYRIQTFATSILPALDSLELALNGKDVSDPFVKGVKLTYDQLINALAKEGVVQVDILNKPFDANNAHAIMSEKVENVEPNMVVEVLQKGYMLKDRLLRAALVKVSE